MRTVTGCVGGTNIELIVRSVYSHCSVDASADHEACMLMRVISCMYAVDMSIDNEGATELGRGLGALKGMRDLELDLKGTYSA